MEAKQYATKQPRDQWWNQRANQKMPRNKWQWKPNDPKPMGCSKNVLREKFITIQSYLKKQEISQINKLTLHPKQLEKERKKKQTNSAEERHPKDQIRNKWKRNEGNNTKDQ